MGAPERASRDVPAVQCRFRRRPFDVLLGGSDVNCIPRPYEADTDGGSLPERELQRALAQQVRNRQAAALYLQAATLTDDAVARQLLRQCAAGLILPDRRDRGQRLAG